MNDIQRKTLGCGNYSVSGGAPYITFLLTIWS